MIVNAALLCLSLNIYYEARGEPIEGQFAVAHVTMNRAKTEDKVCKAVYAPKQFSWTESVKSGNGKPTVNDTKSWKRAQRVAYLVLNGHWDVTGGAIMYHATHVSPHTDGRWNMRKIRRITMIGNHVFYVARA